MTNIPSHGGTYLRQFPLRLEAQEQSLILFEDNQNVLSLVRYPSLACINNFSRKVTAKLLKHITYLHLQKRRS